MAAMREVPPEGESGEVQPDGVSGIQGRPPPFDIDAEGSVLGACFFSDDRPECLEVAVRMLRPRDFYSDRHARIFEAVLELAAGNESINIVSVGTLLKDKGRIAQVGGMGYLTELINFVPAVNERFVVQAATIVREKARVRRAIALVQRFQAEAYLDYGDVEGFFARFEKEFVGLREQPRDRLPKLIESRSADIERMMRRISGEETPIELPWPTLNAHFGGGFWPGVHYVTSTTGIGKTAWALQLALAVAKKSVPVAYVGLETDQLQLAMRIYGDEAGVPWSRAYTGQASEEEGGRVALAADRLAALGLPLHVEYGRPQGWPVSRLAEIGEMMRREYPEPNGRGSRPLLLILDFLQIIGAEEASKGERSVELRERIGRAAYVCRDLAARLDIVVLVISSIAREKYEVLNKACDLLGFVPGDDGEPTRRRILAPDKLVGLGKESGEIEYSGDSVSVLFWSDNETQTDLETNMIFATAKGRATGQTWSPMVFTGFRYIEPFDGGATWVAAKEDKKNKRDQDKANRDAEKETANETKRLAKEARKSDLERRKEQKTAERRQRLIADAVAAVQFIRDAPSAPSVRAVRVAAAGDESTRWKAVKELLGGGLVALSAARGGSAGLALDEAKLPELVLEALAASEVGK